MTDQSPTKKTRVDEPTGTSTVGHEWDGIEELNTPLPRWWLYTFYATIVWAIGYMIMYPAWPLLNSATKGVLGWTSRGQLAEQTKAAEVARAPIIKAISDTPLEQLITNRPLYQTAIAGGAAAYKVNCVQCHGSGAEGYKGYPNLNDDDWLWGGDIAAIHYTLEHGIRNPDHDDTRLSLMSSYKDVLSTQEIGAVVSHVRSLSDLEAANAAGAQVFATHCVSCHGAEGKGGRDVGAPNLSDSIWLYGGDRETLTQTLMNGRGGVMPRWNNRLDPATIKMLAVYVHSLGGGEANPAPAALPPQGNAGNGQP